MQFASFRAASHAELERFRKLCGSASMDVSLDTSAAGEGGAIDVEVRTSSHKDFLLIHTALLVGADSMIYETITMQRLADNPWAGSNRDRAEAAAKDAIDRARNSAASRGPAA